MLFQHIYDKSLAQASYLIGCQKLGVAAVIDPKRDVDTYIEIANQNNMKITHIFETHIVGTILNNLGKISKEKEVIIHCQGGDRSSIAYSLLGKEGFTNVTNYSPGMNEWISLGNETVIE